MPINRLCCLQSLSPQTVGPAMSTCWTIHAGPRAMYLLTVFCGFYRWIDRMYRGRWFEPSWAHKAVIMEFVYILKCNDGTYFTGHTNNLEERIRRHNKGENTYTKPQRPVELITYLAFSDKYKAFEFESESNRELFNLSVVVWTPIPKIIAIWRQFFRQYSCKSMQTL